MQDLTKRGGGNILKVTVPQTAEAGERDVLLNSGAVGSRARPRAQKSA